MLLIGSLRQLFVQDEFFRFLPNGRERSMTIHELRMFMNRCPAHALPKSVFKAFTTYAINFLSDRLIRFNKAKMLFKRPPDLPQESKLRESARISRSRIDLLLSEHFQLLWLMLLVQWNGYRGTIRTWLVLNTKWSSTSCTSPSPTAWTGLCMLKLFRFRWYRSAVSRRCGQSSGGITAGEVIISWRNHI